MSDDLIRLNVGSGDMKIPGFISIDRKFGHDARKLEYPDDSVAEVYSSHTLEHFGVREVPLVLAEWCRVVAPGGRVRIAVPSFELAYKIHEKGGYGWELCNRYICGGQTDNHDIHMCQFTRESLTALMRQCGLSDIKAWTPEYPDTSNNPVSIRLEGTKWAFAPCDRKRLVGVVPCPRLGFKAQERCLRNLIFAHGCFPVDEGGGAFWEKAIETQLQRVLNANPDADYIVCFDYDSVYTPEDLDRLLDHMDANPKLGAIFPVQQSRHEDAPLVFYPNRHDYSTPVTRVSFGHFGLTVIRRAVFELIADQHPWFFSIPDTNGRWDSWRTSDGDISFWRLLAANGIPVAQANDVCIGHMEHGVRWTGKDGKTLCQWIADYENNGKPDGVGLDADAYMKVFAEKAAEENAKKEAAAKPPASATAPEPAPEPSPAPEVFPVELPSHEDPPETFAEPPAHEREENPIGA